MDYIQTSRNLKFAPLLLRGFTYLHTHKHLYIHTHTHNTNIYCFKRYEKKVKEVLKNVKTIAGRHSFCSFTLSLTHKCAHTNTIHTCANIQTPTIYTHKRLFTNMHADAQHTQKLEKNYILIRAKNGIRNGAQTYKITDENIPFLSIGSAFRRRNPLLQALDSDSKHKGQK